MEVGDRLVVEGLDLPWIQALAPQEASCCQSLRLDLEISQFQPALGHHFAPEFGLEERDHGFEE